jgi:hypothetical protein
LPERQKTQVKAQITLANKKSQLHNEEIHKRFLRACARLSPSRQFTRS